MGVRAEMDDVADLHQTNSTLFSSQSITRSYSSLMNLNSISPSIYHLYISYISTMHQEEEGLEALRKLNPQPTEVEHTFAPPSPTPHVHGENCSHGKDERNAKQKKNPMVMVYTVFTCLSCLYLETQHLNPEIGDNLSKYLSMFAYMNVFMCLWSYFQTIRISSAVKPLKLGQLYYPAGIDRNSITDKNYDFYKKRCDKCNYYKFPRVSHCSTCGYCIYKMDHHCIWTQTCIGYRNQRPFYLFCIYMAVGAVQFWYTTIRVTSKLFTACQFFSTFEPGVYILWAITCLSACVIGLMILMLALGHTLMILTNFTTLDSIKKKECAPIPFFQFRKRYFSADTINTYDRGELQNLKSLFGRNILTFWMPLGREVQNEIMFEAMNPEPTVSQLMNFPGEVGEEVRREKEISKYSASISIEQLKRLNMGKKFLIKGEVIKLSQSI